MMARKRLNLAALILLVSGCHQSTQRLRVEPHGLANLKVVDSSLVIDARYATPNNFVGVPLYPENTLFLQEMVATRLARVNSGLRGRGTRIKVWDAYRPHSVQRRMWQLVPDERYVANPEKGSNHNRGCAVDVTLTDASGLELTMPTPFDDFSERAHIAYSRLGAAESANRRTLQEAMKAESFVPLPTEWWHFDASDCRDYPVLDVNPFGKPMPVAGE
jgi:D-alanyl-D-alanine dipeptidase